MREDARKGRRNERKDEGNANAERDECEHVEVHRPEGARAALEEGPSAPEHDRNGQCELSPLGPAGWQQTFERLARDEVAHSVNGKRDGEDCANPEPTCHVVEFGCVLRADDDAFRFERHAAYWTAGIAYIANVGMHGAGIDCAGIRRRHKIIFSVGTRISVAPGMTAIMTGVVTLMFMMSMRVILVISICHVRPSGVWLKCFFVRPVP